jgi:hypothetical protein
MKQLTIKEEYQLLEELISEGVDFIHNGSSRAVYEFDTNRVIKVAMDRQGRRQNKNEIDLFRSAGNDYLAEIYAYGAFVIVMEKVDEECMETCMDIYFDNDEYVEYTDKERDQVMEVVDFLNDHVGETDDNFQLGKSFTRGKFVSYDYGYNTEYHNSEIVSGNLSNYVDYKGPDSLLQRTARMLKILLDRSVKV